MALIIFKSLDLDIDEFLDKIDEAVSIVARVLNVPFFKTIMIPFVDLYKILLNFKVDFGVINVSCLGAIKPYNLSVNLVVLCTVIFIVESDIQLFRNITHSRVYQSMSSIYFHEYYFSWAIREKGTRLTPSIKGVFWYIFKVSEALLSQAMFQIDYFQNILLFSMASLTFR